MSIQSSNLDSVNLNQAKSTDSSTDEIDKFGTFVGVFIPCILMLFGVIIFLRLGWIVGQVGLSTTLVIITLSALIALITSLSMASIATNIEVGEGGIYYIIARSLGIEIGSAIGIPLFLKEALTISFCIIGFAESIHDLSPHWQIHNISIATLIVVTLLAFTSIKGALKVQIGILLAIIAALFSFFLGGKIISMPPDTLISPPSYTLNFWAVFAVFFPAMTGMESSASLSGNLKNPNRSLPVGTISAILVGYLTYIAIAVFLNKHVPLNRLAEDPLIMQDIARIPALITVGIWGATLSSAIGGLLGAPRSLQAMAKDGIIPKIFSKTFGATSQSQIATATTSFLAFIGIYFGSINLIAPLLAMISLICYAVLNLSSGIESLMENPSWRPRFRIHWTLSITGAALCLIAMLMINSGYALLSLFLIALIYFIVKKRQLQASWMDMRQGIILFFSRSAIYHLAYNSHSSRAWRPHFLVFTKHSEEHSTYLLKFAEAMSQNKSFLTMISFLSLGEKTFRQRNELSKSIANRFREKNIYAFVQVKESDTIASGMHHTIEHYGLGPLVPNTIILGGITKEENSMDFAPVLKLAHERLFNIILTNEDSLTDTLDKQSNQDIHIWWDDANPHNSELMLVLAYMLQRNRLWKKTRICVNAVVDSELSKKNKILELKEIGINKRLPLDIKVFVSQKRGKEGFELIREFSKDAVVTFTGIAQPKKNEPIQQYSQYIQEVSFAAKHCNSLALVLSSKGNDLENVLI